MEGGWACPSLSLSLRAASLIPSLLWVGGGTSAFLAQPGDFHLRGWDQTQKRLLGKGCIWASISWADSPLVPRLAALVWLISQMKSWTGPASSQPSWDLHPLPADSQPTHIPVLLVGGSAALKGTHVCSHGQLDGRRNAGPFGATHSGLQTQKANVLQRAGSESQLHPAFWQ